MLLDVGANIHGKGGSLVWFAKWKIMNIEHSTHNVYLNTYSLSLLTGRRGYTPLHFAALRGHHSAVDKSNGLESWL